MGEKSTLHWGEASLKHIIIYGFLCLILLPKLIFIFNLCARAFAVLDEDCVLTLQRHLKENNEINKYFYSVWSPIAGLTFTPHWLIEKLFVIISRGSCWLSGIPGLPRVQKLQTTDINNLLNQMIHLLHVDTFPSTEAKNWMQICTMQPCSATE